MDDTSSCVDEASVGVPRINRCRSSPSFSSSLSEPSASNAEARLGSETFCLCRLVRERGEEEREWKDGGGEEGVMGVGRPSSVAATCVNALVECFYGGMAGEWWLRETMESHRRSDEADVPARIARNSSFPFCLSISYLSVTIFKNSKGKQCSRSKDGVC